MSSQHSSSSQPTLKATYASPTDSKLFTYPLSNTSTPSNIEEKTAYLAELRESVVKLQGDINTLLTQKMEDTKAAGSNKQLQVEVEEEENYGEEIIAEDN
ncbi:MAG: hypothetical protein M1834_002901 [Cirrosporium novae-zelandiae]|nr:MAG: hypothetical protein M1834_002901 [Cirrosporium novae-zelandiae]